MKIYTEITLRNYEFKTEQAKRNAALLTPEELDAVDFILEQDVYDFGFRWDASDLEGLFRFEFDEVCNWLDIDVDEVYNRGNSPLFFKFWMLNIQKKELTKRAHSDII